jgi:putative transposase
VKGHQADHPIATVCRVLGVSPSGYYAWRHRAPSARAEQDAELTMKIHTIHLESRGTYGAPWVHAELAAQDMHVGRKRVARLMRAAGVRGVSRRKGVPTTTRDLEARPAPDLVQRAFHVDGPDRLWVADITYVPTGAGFLYLSVVLDAWSRRVIGWAMATHLRTELVLAALDMALRSARRTALSIIPITGASTLRSPTGSDARASASGRRWGRSATRTTMPCVKASSRPSSVSGSTASPSGHPPRRGASCSTTSKAGHDMRVICGSSVRVGESRSQRHGRR